MNKSFTILFGVSTGCMVLCLALFGFLNVPKLKIEHKPLNFKGLIDKDAMPASCVVLVFLLTYGALENYTLKFVSQTDKITLSGGVYFTVMAMAVNIAPPERRGAANSTFLCAYDIGIGIGGGIAGVLIDAVGYNYMFAIISVANIISIIIYFAWGSKHPSSMTYRIKNKFN